MRIAILTAVTMTFFAANSVLNRAAIAGDHIDAVSFGVVRLIAGALMLALLCLAFSKPFRVSLKAMWPGALALLIYMFGFSLAYEGLDAGVGALVLFGFVQLTMFAGALVSREALPITRWLGAMTAFAGLAWLFWPGGAVAIPVLQGVSMAAAGIGWGVYSLLGRRQSEPLSATASNFVIAAVVAFPALPLVLWGGNTPGLTTEGLALAIASGAVASGMGYSLWYMLLPRLGASLGAVVQLTVPLIATAGGVALLGETLSAKFAVAAALVLGGVGLSLMPKRRAT